MLKAGAAQRQQGLVLLQDLQINGQQTGKRAILTSSPCIPETDIEGSVAAARDVHFICC